MDHQRIYKDMEEVGRSTDSWESTSIHSLEQCRSKARDIAHYQGKVEELEAHFRELDEAYLHTKAVKESKNQEWVANAELLSSTKSRTEDLTKMKQILSERRHEREMIISEQLTALTMLEESNQPDLRFKRGHQEAVAWYNRALGFRIECGHGIKFIFVNVDQVSPAREFSFSIRHCRRNDRYTLLDCDPSFEGTRELLDELNQTNDLFKFVRVMRKKFQELSLKDYKEG
ncbi:kinetochore protein SPC25 homolog isoform X2 [Cryptomeria japonica]|uniref:kinetochore protein SPC25 homolog isoform X2 n=1 Tax=Cryptomeria japonica TaxID=3369 RepID=UPI0025AD98DD|nr:kinetochore protein SPC25 homolog isoform X2 [Cryptomeria japonica]